MNIIFKIMGLVAGMNASLSRQSLNFIPANWIVIGACGVTSGVMADIWRREADPWGIVIGLLTLIVGLAFLISTLKRDTFFRAASKAPAPVSARAEAAILEVPFGFTGKLRLHEKLAQRFLDVPAHATRLDGGDLAFASNIDASTRYSGVVTKSKVGLWISVPRFDSPKIECGTLFYGKKSRPALRMQYVETSDAKTRLVKAIFSFDVPLDRDAMRDFLASQTQSIAIPVVASPFSTAPVS